jgi:hypothetical protein
MQTFGWVALLSFVPSLCAGVPQPADWVPARWSWSDAKSLELLADSPVNCLLLKSYTTDFVAAAEKRGLVTLAVIAPGGNAVAEARNALAAKVTGIVLEGSFPEVTAAAVQRAAGNAPVVQLTARSLLPLGLSTPILGTYQGVWPGIAVEENGATKGGATGTIWIDTNTGFIRAVRAWGNATVWIAVQPPAKTIITGERYLQVIADAAISGARWVLALDDDFAQRLNNRQAAGMRDWRRISVLLRYFEQHPEWRRMTEYGKLAVVQDPASGGLLTGGVLDMMAAKHMPERLIPRRYLTPDAIRDLNVILELDSGALTARQEQALRGFTSAGGTLLTGPPIWKNAGATDDRFMLNKAEFDELDAVWKELSPKMPRRSFGVRLFNVSSMLSNVLVSAAGKTLVVHLVNYSDYPVENISVMFPDDYKKATLTTPERAAQNLEISQSNEGSGVTVETVSVCAEVKLER